MRDPKIGEGGLVVKNILHDCEAKARDCNSN